MLEHQRVHRALGSAPHTISASSTCMGSTSVVELIPATRGSQQFGGFPSAPVSHKGRTEGPPAWREASQQMLPRPPLHHHRPIMDQMPIPVPLGMSGNHHMPLLPTKVGVLPTSGHGERQVVHDRELYPCTTSHYPCLLSCFVIHQQHAWFPFPISCAASPVPRDSHPLLRLSSHRRFPMPHLTRGHLICNPESTTFRIELKTSMTNIRSARFVFWELLDFCLLFYQLHGQLEIYPTKAAAKHKLFCHVQTC